MTKFQLQQAGSTVNWTGKKVLGLHTGNINLSGGSIEMEDGHIQAAEMIMDMTSIIVTDIGDPKTNKDFRDHLLHEDFFSVEKFPTALLTVTSAIANGKDQYSIEAVLTIKGISHPVSFNASVAVFTDTLHALGEITIDRTLYNIRYGSGKFFQNLGDKLIYDDFVLQFKVIAHKAQ